MKKEYRGLRIREFNVALLEMWCWRLRDERDGLRYRVSVECCGEVGSL